MDEVYICLRVLHLLASVVKSSYSTLLLLRLKTHYMTLDRILHMIYFILVCTSQHRLWPVGTKIYNLILQVCEQTENRPLPTMSVSNGWFCLSPTTLNTRALQGCVLKTLLFTLMTHNCVATNSLNHLIKFVSEMCWVSSARTATEHIERRCRT